MPGNGQLQEPHPRARRISSTKISTIRKSARMPVATAGYVGVSRLVFHVLQFLRLDSDKKTRFALADPLRSIS